jgi:hypothetical protein
MVKGRLDQNATTATSYAWLVWQRNLDLACPRLIWVPPCRKRVERSSDYDAGIMRQPELNSFRSGMIDACASCSAGGTEDQKCRSIRCGARGRPAEAPVPALKPALAATVWRAWVLESLFVASPADR